MSNKIDEKLNSLYKQRALIESSVATSIAEMSIGSWYLPNNRNITVDENYKIKKGD